MLIFMMVDNTNNTDKLRCWKFFSHFELLKRDENGEKNINQNKNHQNTANRLEPVPIVVETFNSLDVPGISFLWCTMNYIGSVVDKRVH